MMWLKILVRLGLVVLKHPPKEVRRDSLKDAVMAFHHCRLCGATQYDRLYDWVSLNEHYFCGVCGARRDTRSAFGFMFFPLIEAARTVREEKLGRFQFYLRMLTGVPERLLPFDRGGKTAGELEMGTGAVVLGFMRQLVETERS